MTSDAPRIDTVAPVERVAASVASESSDGALAVVSGSTAIAQTNGAVSSEGAGDDSTNVWPDEAAEAAFLAESGEKNGTSAVSPVVSPPAGDEEPPAPLPALDALVQRIPPETRELLDELFRAKFITVRRVRKTDLKA